MRGALGTATRTVRQGRNYVRSAADNRTMSATVAQLRAARRPASSAAIAPAFKSVLDVELMRSPPKPPGIAACVAWLQENPAELAGRQMASRALDSLRGALFSAPGRDAEMNLLWREALASACYARVVAAQSSFDAPLLTGAALLHRTGEIAALRALARAEQVSNQRMPTPVVQTVMDSYDDALVSRVTRSWSLAGEVRLTILRWRDEQDSLNRPRCVTLLMMVQALATELVHAATCTPGLADVAQQSLGLPSALVNAARDATAGIAKMLQQIAPQIA